MQLRRLRKVTEIDVRALERIRVNGFVILYLTNDEDASKAGYMAPSRVKRLIRLGLIEGRGDALLDRIDQTYKLSELGIGVLNASAEGQEVDGAGALCA